MTRFRFRLDRVLQWRRLELSIEELAVERLNTALRGWQARLAENQNAGPAALEQLMASSELDGRALDQLLSYRVRLESEAQEIRRRIAECERNLASQHQRIALARRRVRLLENLEQRRKGEWLRNSERELEILASESAQGRWVRDHSEEDEELAKQDRE